ncbi:MAG: methyltransferase domain-containing protein [Verrucomicrobia bacterium]|nr:methyltransferase domain-containing protein [Verrucomicrobiota bacterium]
MNPFASGPQTHSQTDLTTKALVPLVTFLRTDERPRRQKESDGRRAEHPGGADMERNYRADNPANYSKRNRWSYNNEMGRYRTEKQLTFIRNHLPGEGLRILDIGGGDGRLSVPLATSGHKVTVLDVAATALKNLAAEGHPSIECVHSDILSFATQRHFDAAIAVDSIKYMTHASLERLFSKINGLLAERGVFMFAEMNTNSWRNHFRVWLGRDFRPYRIGSHLGYASALREAGFEVAAMSGFSWMPVAFNSNSRFVRLFQRLEEVLNLHSWISQSPWLLVAARKNGHPAPCPERNSRSAVLPVALSAEA